MPSPRGGASTVEQRAAKMERLAEPFEENVKKLAAFMTKEMEAPWNEAREHTELCVRSQRSSSGTSAVFSGLF